MKRIKQILTNKERKDIIKKIQEDVKNFNSKNNTKFEFASTWGHYLQFNRIDQEGTFRMTKPLYKFELETTGKTEIMVEAFWAGFKIAYGAVFELKEKK